MLYYCFIVMSVVMAYNSMSFFAPSLPIFLEEEVIISNTCTIGQKLSEFEVVVCTNDSIVVKRKIWHYTYDF